MLKRANGAMEVIVRQRCSQPIVVAAVIVFLSLHEKGTETLLRFPDDPASYRNLADAFWTVGWKHETREILQQAVERFPDDSELLSFLRNVEDDLNDPNGGEILGLLLIVVAVSAHKKLRKK
jgi:hypothetical protein